MRICSPTATNKCTVQVAWPCLRERCIWPHATNKQKDAHKSSVQQKKPSLHRVLFLFILLLFEGGCWFLFIMKSNRK